MTGALSEELLSEISRWLADRMALNFPRERWFDLERGIRSAAPALGCADGEACARHLLSSPLTRRQIEILAGELTVGETYFFREKQCLEILYNRILPEMARAREGTERRLRIWSAGCCTGEEPYSIAIMLDRFLPELRDWQVTILGTDINPRFLQKAAKGVFSEWSFRDAPPWLKETYFKPAKGKHYEIIPRIREKVTFDYLNLAEEVYPSLITQTNAMDLILCRNVLMYFGPERAKSVIHCFHSSLVTGGWLLVSPTETSCELFSEFSAVQFQRMTLYRKGDKPVVMNEPLPPMEIIPIKPAPAVVSPPVLNFIPPLPIEEPVMAPVPVPAEESAAAHARGCANLGQLSEALSWVEKALATDKLDAGLHYLRAVILQEQGLADEVVPSLKRALYLDPNFVLAHYALGHLALRQGKTRETARHFANVLALLADYPSDDILPQSDGLAAGRLRAMVESAQPLEKIA